MWIPLVAEEATEETVATKKEARARAKAQPACTDDEEDTKDYSSEGDTSSSNASDATSCSEEVASRKRLCEDDEDDEARPSKNKWLIYVISLKISLNIFFRSFYVKFVSKYCTILNLNRAHGRPRWTKCVRPLDCRCKRTRLA
jgi:hypothetical protein